MKKDRSNILLIFVVALTILLPLFIGDYHSRDDSYYHVLNVYEYSKQIKLNFFSPNQIVGGIANDFGYGTRLFYPPLAHNVVAYLFVLIGDIFLSFNITYLVSLFLSGLSMYYLSKKLSKNKKIALLSSIIYMLLPYHISDIYIRDAIAESFIFIFLPLIMSGLYELQYGDKKKFYPLFIFGYVGGIFSHLVLMVYFTVLIFIFLIWHFKDTIKNIKHYIIASIFILLLASPFLITVIEHKLLGDYLVYKDGVMAQNIMGVGLFPYNYINIISGFGSNGIKYFFDIVSLLFLIGTIINYKKIKIHPFYKFIIVFGLVSFLMSLKLFPWDLLPQSFRMVQFPWRFVTFVSLTVALVAPLSFQLIKKHQNIVVVGSIIAIILFIYPNLNYRNDNLIDMDNPPYYIGMGWLKEYLPVKTSEHLDYFDNRNNDIIVMDGEADINVIKNQVPYLEFEIDNEATIEFPRLFYIGYTLKDNNGNKIELFEDKYGFLSASVEEGTYILDHTGTTMDNLCKVLSVISLIGFIGWRIYEKNKYNSTLL